MNKRNRLMRLSNAFRGLAAIALVMSFLALPAPVAADTTTLYPNAVGTYQAWSIFGGAPTHWQATSDLSDSTGVQITGATTSRETENLQDTSQTGTINSVTAYMRARATSGSSQVTYVAAGTASGTTGNPTPAYPAGLQANDLILLQVTVRDTSTTPTTPAGFTLLYDPDSTGTGRQWIYYRFSNGTETGTITVTIGGGACKIARMYAFRNVALSSFTEGASFGSETGRRIYAQDVTTTDARRLAVSFVFVNDNNSVGSFTGETGGDWVEAVAEFRTNAGSDGTVQLQTATMASAGTISGGSYRMRQSDPWGVRAFALIPVTDTVAEQAVILWRTHSIDYESSAQTISRAAFTNYSETRATNPNTGSAWTWAEINALEVGSRASTLGTGEIIQCSEYWIVVDYTPPVPLPDANFTASPTSGCTPLNVTFTDASTGNPTSWSWSFPGGNPSTATGQGPHSVIYNSAGSYNVSLTVTNAYGPDTETKPNYITVNQTPTVTISGNPNICGAGNSTTLTANVSGGSSPYNYDWSPSTAPGTASNNTFTATGAGTVAVAVTDNLGCTGRAKTIVAVKSSPTVNITGNLTFCEGGNTILTANASGGTPPYTYDWSTSTAPGSYVDNTYTATGAGTVAVTVTDSAGCRGVVISDTTTQVTQGNVPGATHPYNAVLGWVHPSWWGGLTGYTFDYSPSHTNTAAQWIWESYRVVHPIVGDIVYFERSFNIPGTPTGATIYMTCDNGYEVYINGNYLGRAQLGDGWETSDLSEPYVQGDGWQSVEAWPVAAGLLNSGTNVLLAKAANELMESGSGDPSSNPGGLIYEVVYEYTYDCGCTATDSVTVTVNPAPTATASSNSPVMEGATIELYGGPDGMSSYSWSGPNGFSSPLRNPTIPNATITMSGTYTLTVTDANGCQDDASTDVEVTSAPTIAGIEIYATQDCSGPPVTSMTPQTIYYAKVSITSSNNLSYLQTVQVTLFYDSAGNDPTAPVISDTHTCAILTCNVGTPPSWTIEPNNTPPNPLTTWEIVPGECVQPANLDVTSGDWIFAFMPGKVATEAPSASYPNADWDAQGKATNKANQSSELYVRDKAMNWYGEITVPLSVDWGEVPLGLTFETVPENPETASIKYIANGDYFEDISSSDTWTGSGESVTLNVTGGNPPPAGMFALMADNTAVLADALVVTTNYKHINASGSLTGEDGVTVDANSLWLSLGETDIFPVIYSGSIYFQIAER
jgi:PKD repeat protein